MPKLYVEKHVPTDQTLVIHEILVSVGDKVSKRQPLFVAEGSKSVFDIEASANGTIIAIFVSEGDSVEIGIELCEIKEN